MVRDFTGKCHKTDFPAAKGKCDWSDRDQCSDWSLSSDFGKNSDGHKDWAKLDWSDSVCVTSLIRIHSVICTNILKFMDSSYGQQSFDCFQSAS